MLSDESLYSWVYDDDDDDDQHHCPHRHKAHVAYSGGLFGRLIRGAVLFGELRSGAAWLIFGKLIRVRSLIQGCVFGVTRAYPGCYSGLVRGVTRAESWVIQAASWSSGAYFGHRPLLTGVHIGLQLPVRQAVQLHSGRWR